MPNTSNDDVIIVGSLSDKELRDSIDKLVDYVGDKTTVMAGKFDVAMEKMKSAMKDFAITQKVSVDLMQDAWKQMSASFDAMLKAQQNATSSSNNSGAGGGSGKPTYPDNTVGHLQEIIALEEKRRKEMTLDTQELRDQNKLIAEQKNKLKDQTTPVATKVLEAGLRKQVVTLQDAKDKLSMLESIQKNYANTTTLSVAEQNKLTRAIAQTKKQIETLQAKQPKKLQDVLGMDESSVDAIAKKMQALKRVSIDPTNTAQVKQLGDEYQRLKRLQAELMGQNIQMTHSNNYLAQSFGYIRNRLVYALTLGAITSFTKQVYEIRGQYELLERSLGVLVNSFERGSQIFQELNQMAIESPFTLMELAGTAKQLTAYNFAANEVVDTTRRLADISAALGVPMERLTYNLGQIRAQTVLTARDARDFANAGLPIVASLAEHFTELEGKIVTTGDVYDRMSKKMVSYSDVMAVLNKMTDEGGKFFEFQAKQAETLRVQMANLNLAWNNMLNDIGKSNQGLLTLPISGLKALLQNWQTIDRVLKSMLYTFVGWKALQMVAIRQQWAWATATGATAKQMGFLANAAKGLFASMKVLFLNPWTWVFVGIMAVIDLVRQTNAAREAMHELNQEIRDNANEASESMLNYLNNKGNQSTRQLAQQNKLTAEEGERAWESLKGQIEQSAISANGLISELLTIDDINERVAKGFDYAERIQKAQAALQDLKDDSIDINTDIGWFGLFGEGLVSDLKDYADYIEKYSEIARNNQIAGEVASEWMHQVGVVKDARREFLEELDDTAESINNFIRAYNITDPLQINEILERVRSQIKAKNPEIKGEAAKIFDISLDQKMYELTNGAVDRNASLWNMFMERLKHNSSSAFQDINDDWVKNNEALSSEQQAAVDANLQYFKDSMPYAYDAVAKMVADASQLKIHIGIAFNVQQLSDFQKEVKQRIGNSVGPLDFGGGAFLPTNNDNLSSWVKTQQQAIKSLKEENKKYALDDTQWSKGRIAANNREIQQRKNLLDLFHQQYAEEKNIRKVGGRKVGNRKPEDVVAEALKQELQLIREMQSNYEKLRKSGVSNMDAIDLASKGYEATIIRINKVLSKFGIDKFNAANFAGKDVRSLLQSLEEQRQALLASGKVKTSSLQALDVEIQKLTVEAKTYDMKKVTDGLNSELGKLKDEYELAIELDANPELGNMFAEMFDIDTSSLPRNIYEYVQSMQDAANNAIQDTAQLDPKSYMQPFDLLSGDIEKWAQETGQDINGYLAKGLISSQNAVRNAMRKYLTDIEKETRDLQYKLSDNNGKIELEEKKLRTLETKLLRETTEEKRRLLQLQIEDQKNTIAELRAVLIQEIPEYAAVFNSVIEHSAYMSKKLIADLRKIYDAAKKRGVNSNGYYTITSLVDGKETLVGKRQFEKELEKLTREERKVQSPFDKIKEAFSKDEITGKMVDFAKGVELVAGEAKKAADGLRTVADIVSALGGSDEAVETLNDIANSIDGVATAAEGVTQIQSGDVIGGTVNVIKGTWQAISTWFDNSDKRIQQNIKDSERAVKRLELAYIDLEHAVNEAYGMATIGANMAAKANKELQLVELKRQLALERSRDSKHRDEDRIIDLQKQIKELEYDIQDTVDSIVNNLLGISSVGDAMENMMDAFIEALRSGEDAMATFDDNVDEMIANMVKKMYVTKILQPWFEEQWKEIQKEIDQRGKDLKVKFSWADSSGYVHESEMALEKYLAGLKTALEEAKAGKYDEFYDIEKRDEHGRAIKTDRETWIRQTEELIARLEKQYYESVTPNEDDIKRYAEMLRGGKPILEDSMDEVNNFLKELGLFKDTAADKSLSALQQGIQGVTEDTAGAIEAYMNIVAQRVFEQNGYLQEIRDHLNNFDLDVQLGTLSQMLLQLQQSYQVQQNIESILTGVLNPSGRAIVVELNS